MKNKIAIIVGVVSALSVRASVISVNFESATQTSNNAPVVHNIIVASGYTVSEFTQGTGIGAFRLDTSTEGDNFISEVAGTNPATNRSQAVSADAYFEFTVTAPVATDFTDLKFSMRGIGSESNGFVTVRSSVDNYASNLGTASGPMTTGGKHPITVDLSAITAFKNRTSVTFRFYVYDEYSGQNNRRIGVDDIELSYFSSPQIISLNFESATQASNNAPVIHNGIVASGYTVSEFTQGTGIGAFRLDTSTEGDNFISEVAGTNPATNRSQAVSAGAYFEFTVTAPVATDFTDLKFAMRGIGSESKGYVTVRSSVDNYASNLGTASGPMTTGGKHPITVDLSAIAAFMNRTSVTFRFYVYDEYSGQNNRRIGVDDIELSFFSVPQPTYPAYGSITYQTVPYFQWSDVVDNPFPGRYRIQIAKNSSFSPNSQLDQDWIPALINHYVPAMEFDPQVLHWRVRYEHEDGTLGSWSASQMFEIKAMPTVITVPLGSSWHQIQNALSNALAQAPSELRFEPGVYPVTRDPNHNAFFRIQQKGNILINGQGCEFVITDQAGKKCDFFYGRGATGPIQFKNFTVDYAPDSLSHFGGQVMDIEYFTYPDCAFTIWADPGTYPSPDPILSTNTHGMVLEPGTLQRWHAIDASPRLEVNETLAEAAANSLFGPGTYRFTPKYNRAAFYNHLQTNHWFILPERGGDLFYVYQNCPDLVINNVTSKACRGRAFIPRKNCERLRVVNNRILRTGNRALGMTSGGINDHSGGAANLSLTNWFSWWEGNTLEYNADDMYNGHNDRLVFRNNTLRGPFRNAIWLHRDRQWVEGNTVIYAGTSGLTLTPGGQYDSENLGNEICHVVNTALIRSNLFIQPRLNGLLMESDTILPLDSSGRRYHTDITIQDNVWVDHQKYEGLSFSYGKRITLLDNVISNTTNSPSFTYNSDPAREIGIYITESDDVLILDNEISDSRIAENKRIVLGTNATNVIIMNP